jgi:hypothetical protein
VKSEKFAAANYFFHFFILSFFPRSQPKSEESEQTVEHQQFVAEAVVPEGLYGGVESIADDR